mmetsp:Transcript_39348/g.83866  ORF Transcript_39348/g.83866 Transcript_39348/m.83866 type:complete len:207 (+) Transcript_39348:904-1524(+)
MPASFSSERFSRSAARASLWFSKRPMSCMPFSVGGNLSTSCFNATGSAPNATASRSRSAAPAGESFMCFSRAKGISAKLAKAGSCTQTCRAARQSLKRISGPNLMCAKEKSCGHENPRFHRVAPLTMVGSRTARRHSPVSATASTAKDRIGPECFPGSFGRRLKNCINFEAVAITSPGSSSSSSSSIFTCSSLISFTGGGSGFTSA